VHFPWNKKKYSIVISGGGSKGAFSVGVLNALKEKNINVTSVIGSSVGAINGVMYVTDEIDKLTKVWATIGVANPWYKKWTFGFIEGILRGSLYDFSPILAWIQELLDLDKLKKSKIKFACVTINIHTGNKKVFTGKDSNIKAGIKASSAHQFGSYPILIDGHHHTDGGLENYIPLETALQIDPDADCYIVISNTKISIQHKQYSSFNFVDRLKRILELSSYFSDKKEFEYLKLKLGKKMIYIEPDDQLVDTLELDNRKIKQFIQHGYDKTKSYKL
jgi:predicted acylesterase/phospholipase RssA